MLLHVYRLILEVTEVTEKHANFIFTVYQSTKSEHLYSWSNNSNHFKLLDTEMQEACSYKLM